MKNTKKSNNKDLGDKKKNNVIEGFFGKTTTKERSLHSRFLKLNADHEADLQFLNSLKPEILDEFCKVSIDFIKKGANKKVITLAAKKLKVNENDVLKTILGLSFLFSESAKSKLTGKEFKLTIKDLELSKDTKKLLINLYKNNRKEIRNLFIKSNNTFGIPQFKDLEWRLDVEIGKRNIDQYITPKYIMKLSTSDDQCNIIQMEYQDLKNITNQLENALNELKNVHVRRIRKYIKC